MSIIYIINSINTEVGKTFISSLLLKGKKKANKKVSYIKPVISGFNKHELKESDIGIALSCLDIKISMENALNLTKYFLKYPTSPNIAAKMENITLNYNEVLQFCIDKINQSKQNNEDLIIETAGGICTPITDYKTMLDLTRDINSYKKAFNILVTSNYLGGISHTLSACKIFNFDQIVLNIKQKTEFDDEIFSTLKNFLGERVVPLGGLEPPRA